MDKNGNVLLALSGKSTTPSAISALLVELDLHLSPDRSSILVDHFNYDALSAPERHDVLLLPRPGALRADLKSYFSGDGLLAIPRAAPQTLGAESSLVAPILKAPATAYSYNRKDDDSSAAAAAADDDVTATGSQLAIVSSMQARNSARLTVLGSVEALEDKWFSATVRQASSGAKQSKTVNREFASQLTAWTFKETGVLKVGAIQHRLAGVDGAEMNPPIYRIKNDIVRSLSLSFFCIHAY